MIEDIIVLLERVRAVKPLVHHITNYVTAADCANVTVAIGASPVMADDINEAAEITTKADALVLNLGTLSERTLPSMAASGKAANAAGIPVVFDPVGAGASKYREHAAAYLLGAVRLSVLRGNISEIRRIAGLNAETKGVDASVKDIARSGDDAATVIKLSQKLRCAVVISGESDMITDGNRVVYIDNGHPLLSRLSGTGCMCASLIGAFSGVAKDDPFTAAAAGMLCMGIAGELAGVDCPGPGTFRARLHDAVFNMDAKSLEQIAKLRTV